MPIRPALDEPSIVVRCGAFGQGKPFSQNYITSSVANPPEYLRESPEYLRIFISYPPPELFQESHENHLKW